MGILLSRTTPDVEHSPYSFNLFQGKQQSENGQDDPLNEKSRVSEAFVVSFLYVLYLD
jgi:hypothetical protein